MKKNEIIPNCMICKWSKKRERGYLLGGYDCLAQADYAPYVYNKKMCKKLYRPRDDK